MEPLLRLLCKITHAHLCKQTSRRDIKAHTLTPPQYTDFCLACAHSRSPIVPCLHATKSRDSFGLFWRSRSCLRRVLPIKMTPHACHVFNYLRDLAAFLWLRFSHSPLFLSRSCVVFDMRILSKYLLPVLLSCVFLWLLRVFYFISFFFLQTTRRGCQLV